MLAAGRIVTFLIFLPIAGVLSLVLPDHEANLYAHRIANGIAILSWVVLLFAFVANQQHRPY